MTMPNTKTHPETIGGRCQLTDSIGPFLGICTPHVRFEPLHQQIGGNLEQNIRHEEDGECNIGLIAHKVQLLWEVHGEGIGNVDS